jgi:UDP-2,3-diacylglucosamine pyrophosphatase LpxH
MHRDAHLDARTVFLSDVHLGTRDCEAARLLAFLEHARMDRLVLLGDVVDLWSLKRDVHWPDAHHAVLRRFVELARRGTDVVYVPGNHDAAFRDLCGVHLAGIEVCREIVHACADGRRFLVVHGDAFDGAVQFSAAVRRCGALAYDATLRLGRGVHAARRALGLGRWSLATWLKQRVPDVRRYVERFERAAAHEARRRGLDGVICGHIHRPGIREVDGILYCNDGDWVEHCTALVEDRAGRLTLVAADTSQAQLAAVLPAFGHAA